jgi:hypothetical protein
LRPTLLAVPLRADRPPLATVLAGRLLPVRRLAGGRLLPWLLRDALRTAWLAARLSAAAPRRGGT